MSQKQLLYGFSALVLAGTVYSEKPNFVIIMSDDAGYVDFGFMGSREFKTPNLDKLAKSGVLFTHAYAGPTCSPSRCAMLTGSYQHRYGFGRNCGARFEEPNDGLPKGVQTLPMDLKKSGYTTGVIGKWHQGAVEGVNQPQDVGFDEFWGLLAGGRNYFGVCTGANAIWRSRTPEPEWVNKKSTVPPDPKKGRYITDAIGDESVDFIKRHADSENPFFLFVSFTSPHTPIQAKSQDMEQFPNLKGVRRKQAAMQFAMDRAVGNILETLEEKSITDKTYVVFLNDNGGSNNSGSNGYLRDIKGSIYEGGIRVPMMISGPGVAKGATYDKQVSHMDLLPTFVNLAGGKLDRAVDGVDLMPFVQGNVEEKPHDELFFRHCKWGVAISTGDWKLVNPINPGEHGTNKPGQWELYNLKNDISEKDNLAEKNPKKVVELKSRIAAWETKISKNRWGQYGKQDRNYFDSFTYNPEKSSNWSVEGAWFDSANIDKPVTLSCQDLYPNAELIFPASKSGRGYTVTNDLFSASGLDAMANRLIFKAKKQRLSILGNSIRLVPSLTGKNPKIDLGSSVALMQSNLKAEGILNIEGSGALQLYGGMDAETVNVNCVTFGFGFKENKISNLNISCKHFLLGGPIVVDKELVINENCDLVIGYKIDDKVVIKASKIDGSFKNKTVRIREKDYKILQDETSITIEPIN